MTNFEDFALNALPVPPCRVLEVGAGKGQLARALRRAGYDVLAIDPTGVWLHRETHRLGLLGDDERGDRWLERWRDDHRNLATFAQLAEALERRFTRLHFSWIPYLAEEYLDADPTAVSRERELLDQGSIKAAAFRYVGGI